MPKGNRTDTNKSGKGTLVRERAPYDDSTPPLQPRVVNILQQPADGRTAPSRTRARSHSEPTSAKHAKHRSCLAQRATPSARIATIGNDFPMRERASSFTSKEDRTSSAVAPAKRIRIAPSTARTCVTSQSRAFLEEAKRLASEQPTPRHDHNS